MKRKIVVVTSSRAEYGHLYWILKDLAADPLFDLKLLVMGAHLSPEFGNTINEIRRDGFEIEAEIECLLSSDSDVGMAKTIGLATLGFADALARIRPDLLLLIADRYEMLAPASVAVALRIPIAHIEGGEVSQGAIDDAVRNALTKLSHIHFACTEKARERIISMGEEPWRVHFTGTPALDALRRRALLTKEELQKKLNLDLSSSAAVIAYHPVTLLDVTTEEFDQLLATLKVVTNQLVFTYPNADAGSRLLIRRSHEFATTRGNARVFVNLDHVTFLSLLQQSAVMVGNSSSGIMESTSLGLPAVNIGLRQQGREHAANVLDAHADSHDIAAKIRTALSSGFRDSVKNLPNPYGDGYASERMLKILREVQLGQKLLMKYPTEVHGASHG
ncbi:MAG TPA: UDP-N-acetylglucosamine 2-epimerase [Terriglobales bacterium]|nr:UDP-N-acetylglucosamine 2-epimerase [Terriglobales bacterium]